MNGDVVFHPKMLGYLNENIILDQSFVAVDTSSVADEEVKYTVDRGGYIDALSKQVKPALGEAIGINYVSAVDKLALISRLQEVEDQDYFERGMELTILKDGVRYRPVDISEFYAVEVDFADDLIRANQQLAVESEDLRV